jgi:hypothetical protein
MEGARNESGYDLYSAITFLLVGLGIGSLLTIVFNPNRRIATEGINSWRTSGLRPQSKAEKRIA